MLPCFFMAYRESGMRPGSSENMKSIAPILATYMDPRALAHGLGWFEMLTYGS
jgi:hypothetical protein